MASFRYGPGQSGSQYNLLFFEHRAGIWELRKPATTAPAGLASDAQAYRRLEWICPRPSGSSEQEQSPR